METKSRIPKIFLKDIGRSYKNLKLIEKYHSELQRAAYFNRNYKEIWNEALTFYLKNENSAPTYISIYIPVYSGVFLGTWSILGYLIFRNKIQNALIKMGLCALAGSASVIQGIRRRNRLMKEDDNIRQYLLGYKTHK